MPQDEFALVNAKEIERALKKVEPELAKRTRRMMAAESKKVRDEIRRDVRAGSKTSSAKGGRTERAVTSGTKGLRPTLKLNRAYGGPSPKKSHIGWFFFGGRRRRYYPSTGTFRVDRQPRSAPEDGWFFYPGVKRARRRVTENVRKILADAIRDAGLG